jgi:hypothetical protein
VLSAWVVALAALAVVLLQRLEGIWPGFAVIVVQGAALVAAGVAADGVIERLTGRSFGWRQPFAAVITVAAALAPVAALGWWMISDETLLERGEATAIPAFMVDAQQEPAQPRTLVLGMNGGTTVDYHLSRGPGVFLGQDAVAVDDARLSDLVGSLVTDPAPDTAERLADFGVAYVVLADLDEDVLAVIDGIAGLERASAGETDAAAWRLDLPAGGVRMVTGSDVASARVLPSSGGEVDTDIDDGDSDRQVLMAERTDDGWEAALDGDDLERVDTGATQAFTLTAEAGRLQVEHSNGRGWWLALQAAVLLLAVVLAAPGRRTQVPEEPEAVR